MEKIYFSTGVKPSKEQIQQIKDLGGKWDFVNKAWEVDYDQMDQLPQLETGKVFLSLEELKQHNAQNVQNSSQATVNNSHEKKEDQNKKELSPELKEAQKFKNGETDDLSPQALTAYVFDQAKFYATKYRGGKMGIEKQIRKDPLFNRSLVYTKAKAFETKMPRIVQTMIVACQDANALITGFYQKLDRAKDPMQKHFINRDISKQVLKVEEKLSTFFPERKQEIMQKKPGQGKIEAEKFINGETSDLTLRALKSHVMSLTHRLCGQPLDTNINDQIASDPILNADLSKTSIKDLNISLPDLKKHIADTVANTREAIGTLNHQCEIGEINDTKRVHQIADLTFKARLASSSILPNNNVLSAQNQNKQQEERFYIPLTKEQEMERAIVKRISGYRYSPQDNVWSVPKSAAMMSAELAGLKIYASHQDFINGKEMDEQQKNAMFVKAEPENAMQQEQVQSNQEQNSCKL